MNDDFKTFREMVVIAYKAITDNDGIPSSLHPFISDVERGFDAIGSGTVLRSSQVASLTAATFVQINRLKSPYA